MFAKSQRELRKFGLVMAGAFGALGGLMLWRKGLTHPTTIVIAASLTFLIAAAVSPRMLAPVEWGWMKLAGLLNYVMTRVVLTLAFFVVVTPLGWFIRVFGSGMPLGPEKGATTYWSPVDAKNGPGSRHRAPF